MISTQDMIIQDTNHHEVTLHDVWAHNLEEEFAKLREIVYDYPFVAMDTEFPGVVMNPEGNFTSKADFNYKQVQCNVNKLKLIQVGLALVDSDGNFPPGNDIWQFNFEFSLYQDEYNTESIDVLKAAGIDFERHEHEGIRMEEFGELLTTSGLICKEKITWITFHSGYDFGYLIKTILNGPLPDNESSFFNFFKGYFPKSYDVKMLIRQPNTINILKGGLQECADQLQVPRIGRRHQAGSDALLTAQLFFKIKQLFFAENWDEVSEKVQGEMYGLGNTLSLLSIFHHLPAQLAMMSNPSILLQNLCDPGMAMGIGENGSCSPSTATLLPDVSSTEASATNSDSSLCKFSTTTTEEKPYTVENSNCGIHMVLESGM